MDATIPNIDLETANRIAANPRLSPEDGLVAAARAIGVDEFVSIDELEDDETEERIAH